MIQSTASRQKGIIRWMAFFQGPRCVCVCVCVCGCVGVWVWVWVGVGVWVYWVGMGEWVSGYVCIYVYVHERQDGELHLVKK